MMRQTNRVYPGEVYQSTAFALGKDAGTETVLILDVPSEASLMLRSVTINQVDCLVIESKFYGSKPGDVVKVSYSTLLSKSFMRIL